MAKHNELGKWGEAEAVRFLEAKGYAILECDWRFGKRDLDIVALTEDACTLVVVEVKTRGTDDMKAPEEAVDVKKMRNLAVAANAYVKEHVVAQEVRFDIISIVGTADKMERIDHLVDAFNPMLVL